ncbi:hypothetical protein [Ramlibacter sp. PS4R-6]|uniref:hypothetical protein n=1 Tax=Ramlibacter sp. PS4R-6 TaxID=3133438 RepID=UPI0030A631D6
MKSLPLAFATLALAGCGALQQAGYGSWLDHIGEQRRAAYPLSPDENRALQAKAGALRARGDAIRAKLATEPDRVQRIAYMRQLVKVGDDLRPVEKVLREGGTDEAPGFHTPGTGQMGGM